jgi:hypothetical protein
MRIRNQEVAYMDQFLRSLRTRRASVQARIDEEQARPAPDHLRLSALKKLRLRFREQIEFVERTNRRGQRVTVSVVRRRARAAALPGSV